jgi:type IV secretion system protein TrbL
MTNFTAPVLAGITSSIVSAVLSAIAHAISSGIASLASWAIGGLAHAASATTAVNLGSWFQGPWRAMLTVASLAALPLFIVGILEVLAHGEGVGGLLRVLGRLVLAGVGALVALALVQLLLGLVDVSCEVVEHTSGISISAALARLGTALGVTAVVGGGGVAAVGALLLALLAALAALVLWLELAMRTVLILVATAFLPLGLSGLLWPKTASWLRRLGEILTAIVISKLVIVVVLVLGAAALTNSTISLTTPGADIDAMVQGVAFLGLATLGLPIALRVVPFAAEAALSSGRGGVLVRSGAAASRMAASANSTSSLLRRTRGSGTSSTDGSEPSDPGSGSPGTGPGGGRGPAGGAPTGSPSGPHPAGGGPTPASSAATKATGGRGGAPGAASDGSGSRSPTRPTTTPAPAGAHGPIDRTTVDTASRIHTPSEPVPSSSATPRPTERPTALPSTPTTRPAPTVRTRPAGGMS